MSEDPLRSLLLAVFQRLRKSGFTLGMGELLAALRALEGGWGKGNSEALRELLRLLWCNSRQEAAEFEAIFDAVQAARTPAAPPPKREPAPQPQRPPHDARASEPPPDETPAESAETRNRLSAFPVRTPFQPPPDQSADELRPYWPVSRRSMVYTWRYLRRPVKDGPRDVLDLEATLERAVRQGFFLEPVFERRENNHAHLVLMIDQGGSMVPFHRFTRDLVETACEESTIERVDVVYFQNVPPDSVYRDPHMMEPLPLQEILAQCTPDTSVLLVSDAGAARGFRRMDRIRKTTEFLVRLKRSTTAVAWLNPMPQERWAGTSAQFIERLAAMFQMDPDGFSNAVDVLRGQPLQPHRREPSRNPLP